MKKILIAASILMLSTASFAQSPEDNVNNGLPPTHSNKLNDKPITRTTQGIGQASANLNQMQIQVTQHGGTEPAYKNEYWNHWEPGIYVDVVSGEPLFSSTDKYDAGNGWPAFHRPINDNFVKTREDKTLGMTRIEVRSATGDSHLGHVFDDNPQGGEHYCINSAALKFIPKEDMERQGYGEYLKLFDKR